MRRRTQPRKFNDRPKEVPDDYITTCKNTKCKKGIFKGQERVWTKNGLVHIGCNNETSYD